MPGYQSTRTFEGLAEFRDTLPQLARASSHPVYVGLGEQYGADNTSIQRDSVRQVEHQAIWNNRDDRLAYIGTDSYEITQHSEVLGIIDDAVGQTVGEIDIGQIRDFGERIDGMLTLNGHDIDVEELVGDGYVPPEGELMSDRSEQFQGFGQHDGTVRDILGVGIRFANSFDASERIRIETMGYRYVCQNWMVWGEETIGEFTQLHIDELDPTDVEELIFDVLDRRDEVESLITESVDDDDYPLSWAAPALEDVGFGSRHQKRIVKRLRSYDNVDDEFRRWDLYNAATAYLDHDVMQSGDDGVNPNVYDRHQNKAIQLLMNEYGLPSSDQLDASEDMLVDLRQ